MSETEAAVEVLESTLTGKDVATLAAVGVTSFLAGGGIAWMVAKRRYSAKFEAYAEEEIAKAKKFYGRLHKTDDEATAIDRLKAYQETVGEQGYTVEAPKQTEEELMEVKESIGEMSEEPEPQVVNIFTASDGEEAFVPERDPAGPYLITKEEFLENEPEFAQVTVTWYTGGNDEVLADDADQQIPDANRHVGLSNLEHFGYGSQSPRSCGWTTTSLCPRATTPRRCWGSSTATLTTTSVVLVCGSSDRNTTDVRPT
jgi:hypothetical protein